MKAKDITQLVVGFMVMSAFVVVLWAVFKVEMPQANKDLALILLGVLASKFGDVVAYNFNSSKGSSEKTDIISKLPPVSVLLLPLLMLTLLSCNTTKPLITEVPIQYKERIVDRLVPVKINEDSLKLRAQFECDSLNNVVLKGMAEQKSKGVNSQLTFSDGLLNYSVVTIHDTIFIAAKDSFIYKEVPVKVEVIKEVNKLTQWQIAQMWAGRILAGLLLAWLLLSFRRRI